MSAEELLSPNSESKLGLQPLEGGIAPDVAHIASLLGPEDFESPIILTPRPAEIREDLKMLAMELFETAHTMTVCPALSSKTQN